MATVTRGGVDEYVSKIKGALDEYELQNPGAVATVYRVTGGVIRIRVVDERFGKMSQGDRHDRLWGFLSDRLDEDTLQEVSVLLPLTAAEQKTSFMNSEFDDPIASAF